MRVCARMVEDVIDDMFSAQVVSQVNEVHQDAGVHLRAGPTIYSALLAHFHHRGSVGPT